MHTADRFDCARSGGGYQYRLCPAEKMPCTEQDFQMMPLDFVRGSQAIMWNNGTLYPIPKAAKYVDDSVCPVVPKGSTWARNPVPRIHTDNVGMAFVGKCVTENYADRGDDYCSEHKADCQQFPTPCPEVERATVANKMMGEWYRSNGVNESSVPDRNTHEGACSGDWTLGMISDELVLPKSIKPGKCARNSFATVCWRCSPYQAGAQMCCRGGGIVRRQRRSGRTCAQPLLAAPSPAPHPLSWRGCTQCADVSIEA